MDELLANITLAPRLRALVDAPLIRRSNSLLLEPLADDDARPEMFQDLTAFEVFVNKFHVDDFIDRAAVPEGQQLSVLIQQGAKAATTLSTRLDKEGKYRIVLSLDVDAPTMTLRFFELRPGEPWGGDDPDEFQLEEILMIDTGTEDSP